MSSTLHLLPNDSGVHLGPKDPFTSITTVSSFGPPSPEPLQCCRSRTLHDSHSTTSYISGSSLPGITPGLYIDEEVTWSTTASGS